MVSSEINLIPTFWLHKHFHSPFPDAQTFVVGRRHETPVLVDKRDRVDGTKMAVVLLNYLAGPRVPLMTDYMNLYPAVV